MKSGVWLITQIVPVFSLQSRQTWRKKVLFKLINFFLSCWRAFYHQKTLLPKFVFQYQRWWLRILNKFLSCWPWQRIEDLHTWFLSYFIILCRLIQTVFHQSSICLFVYQDVILFRWVLNQRQLWMWNGAATAKPPFTCWTWESWTPPVSPQWWWCR